ncbi:MAG TPA: conjugal transfer protein TrbL family protein [Micromonosporaceae bacterium]|jgi:hypothetical protein
MVSWLMEQLLDWLGSAVGAALDGLLAVLGGTLLYVPDVTTLPQVPGLWSQMLGIVNVCYVIAIVAGFAIAMTHETVQSRYAVKDIAPRLVFGVVAANFSLDWAHRILVLAQQLLDAITDGLLAGIDPAATVRNQVIGSMSAPGATFVLVLIIACLVVFLFAAVLFGWLIRFGVLLVLVVAAPLALACHSLPQTDGVARLWWRSFLGTIGTQLLQALVLLAGLGAFFTPSTPIAVLIGVPGSGLLNLMVLTSLLWCAVKVPKLMQRFVLQRGGGGNIGAYLVRVLLVEQAVRSVVPGRLGRTGRRAITRGAR